MSARKRKKRMKLPNNFGCIRYLGTGRRNPYAAYPPVSEYTEKGAVTPKALGYKPTWEEAYELLTTYNLEKQGKIKVNRNVYIDRTPTFAEVYEKFYQEKFFNSPKKLSESAMYSTRAAFNNSSALHNVPFGSIRYDDLQNVVNKCNLKHSSLELIVSLFHQMYKYALKYEIIEKDYSKFIYIPKPDDDERGIPFTNDELKVFWSCKEDPVVEMLLIMCYSGFRIKAFTDMEINLREGYFRGGVKTKASIERTVPIYSGIYDMVAARYSGSRNLLGISANNFREKMYAKLQSFGFPYASTGEKHTPHDCRHTFSRLCEEYGVNENDRKRMMGHSFGNDITNAIYGHRSVEDLRLEIEKIQLP